MLKYLQDEIFSGHKDRDVLFVPFCVCGSGQQDATMYSFIIFLQTALHVLDDTFTHHQEHT
jgi:hypothetical protein